MLRALLLVLVLANVLWWGWSHGHLPAGLLPWPRDDVQRRRVADLEVLPAHLEAGDLVQLLEVVRQRRFRQPVRCRSVRFHGR